MRITSLNSYNTKSPSFQHQLPEMVGNQPLSGYIQRVPGKLLNKHVDKSVRIKDHAKWVTQRSNVEAMFHQYEADIQSFRDRRLNLKELFSCNEDPQSIERNNTDNSIRHEVAFINRNCGEEAKKAFKELCDSLGDLSQVNLEMVCNGGEGSYSVNAGEHSAKVRFSDLRYGSEYSKYNEHNPFSVEYFNGENVAKTIDTIENKFKQSILWKLCAIVRDDHNLKVKEEVKSQNFEAIHNCNT